MNINVTGIAIRASRLATFDEIVAGTFAESVAATNATLAVSDLCKGGVTRIFFTPSAFEITAGDVASLNTATTGLFTAVEKVLCAYATGDPDLAVIFRLHEPFRPLIHKLTPTWQGFCRYDFHLASDGCMKILELNTCCPAGFFYQGIMDRILTAHALTWGGRVTTQQAFVDSRTYASRLESLERATSITPGLVAVLYDESQLTNELMLIADAFRAIGREAEVFNAADLCFLNGNLLAPDGRRISLTYNKFHIQGESAHMGFWSTGWETRYGAFLEGLQKNAFVSINNFGAMVISEDKGILAVLSSPRFGRLFTSEELKLIARHIPWTRIVADAVVELGLETLLENRAKYVLKPRNSTRGQDVLVGAYASEDQWATVIEKSLKNEYVIQEYVKPLNLPIINMRDSVLHVDNMHHTGAMLIVAGVPIGMFSRVSRNPVTNVAVDGLVQPVVIVPEDSWK